VDRNGFCPIHDTHSVDADHKSNNPLCFLGKPGALAELMKFGEPEKSDAILIRCSRFCAVGKIYVWKK